MPMCGGRQALAALAVAGSAPVLIEPEIAFGGRLALLDVEPACRVADLRSRATGCLFRGLRTLPVRLHGRGGRGE